MDQISSSVDIRSHFGVPAAGPMSEMNPCFDQLLHQYGSQGGMPPSGHTGVAHPSAGGRPALSRVSRSVSIRLPPWTVQGERPCKLPVSGQCVNRPLRAAKWGGRRPTACGKSYRVTPAEAPCPLCTPQATRSRPAGDTAPVSAAEQSGRPRLKQVLGRSKETTRCQSLTTGCKESGAEESRTPDLCIANAKVLDANLFSENQLHETGMHQDLLQI